MGAWLMTLITICIEVFCLQASSRRDSGEDSTEG